MFTIQLKLTDTDSSPDTLQEAQVLALSQADCEDFYEGTGRTVTEDMICVGHDNDIYTGACYVSILWSCLSVTLFALICPTS